MMDLTYNKNRESDKGRLEKKPSGSLQVPFQIQSKAINEHKATL